MIKHCCLTLLAFASLAYTPAVNAQTTYNNGAANSLWNDVGNWSLGAAPLSTDNVIFNSSVTPAGTITLSPGSVANSLQFFSDFIHSTVATANLNTFTLSGGDLTLTNGSIFTSSSARAVINSQLLGSGGLTKTGFGNLVLGGSNNYSGTTTINGGVVTLTNSAGFGSDASTVVVNGTGTNGNVGGNGGNLTLAGSYAGGINLARNLSLNGNGSFGNGPSLTSAYSNTVSGSISVSPGGLNDTTITSASGTLTLTGGNLTLADTTARNLIFTGNGSTIIGDKITNNGAVAINTLIKQGNGGMAITNTANDFLGNFRADAGSIRFTDNGQLGGGSSTTKLNIGGGIIELRTDAPNFGTVAKVGMSNASGTIFADHAATGMSTAINQTMALNAVTLTSNRTLTINSRNGYGVSFSSVTGGNLASNNTFTNNGNGLVTYTGNMWANTNTSAARTLTINGTGNTTVTGGITASTNVTAGAVHIFTKAGTGTVTIQGTASTYQGATNVQAGTLAINDFRSITNNSAAITLGAAATAGTLNITGNNVAAAHLTTNKTLDLAGTGAGGNGGINANQTGTSPAIIFNAGVTSSGAIAKTLTLGGANTLINEIKGAIVDNLTGTNNTSLTKADAGTWRLSGANTYTGTTTITGGTLQILGNGAASTTLADTTGITFGANTVTQTAAGTFEMVAASNTATAETVGALTPTAGAATIKASLNGTGTSALTFASLGTRGAGATINYSVSAGSAIGFTSLPVVTNSIIAAATGGAAFQTYNGVDWATLSGSNVAQYTGYTTTAIPAGTGGAAINYSMNASQSVAAASVNTLKIIGGAGNPTLTLSGLLTVTAKGILFDNSAGAGTITGSTVGAAASELVVITNGTTPGNALTIGSLIGSTTASLTKSGTGTLILSAANAYTGNTNINEGTVRLSGATATLGTVTTAANATSLRQGATLDINGAGPSATVAIGGALNGAGTVTNSGNGASTAGTLVLGVAGSSGAGTFSGVIQDGPGGTGGVLNLTKLGTGTQTLSGTNTYTGVTTVGTSGLIAATTLADIGSNSSIGKGVATSNATNAASLVFAGTTAGISYTGTTSVSTNRLFTFNGSAANSGGQIANASANQSTLIFSNTGALAFGASAASTPQILTLGGASTGDNTFNPQITNNGANVTSVNKIGAGTWVLGGTSNSYTGATNVQQGILRIGDDSGAGTTRTLATNSPLTLGATTNSGVLESTGSFTRALSSSATAGTGTVTWTGTTGGGGFASAGSKFTVNLGGAGATLTWGSGGFVPTGAALILGSANALGEVEFQNGIDLGGAARTIQTDDNANTGFDISTISGVISGAGGGINKTGGSGGILQLTGANTYTGNTTIAAGTLVVSSLGNSSGTTSSSVGASGGAVLIGNATTTGGTLTYVGGGEVSSRLIQINTTTAAVTIESNGSGPLVLTNVQNNLVGGAHTLTLRGFNLDGNEVSSVLADNGANLLSVSKADYGTWILSGANTYTGTTTITGSLGVGNNAAFGPSGTVTLNVASLFSAGGDHTVSNPVTMTNNAINQFYGENNLTLSGPVSVAAGNNTNTYINNMAPGKVLTFSNTFSHADTNNKPQTFGGSGATTFSGQITNTNTGNLAMTINGTGTNVVTYANVGTPNDYRGATVISSGTLKLGASNQVPNGATAGAFSLNPGTGQTAKFDLNGFNETLNDITGTGVGTMIIDNGAVAASTLTIGDNNAAVNYNGSITRSGGGNINLAKIGTGTATFNGPADINTINVSAGTLKLNSSVGMTTGVGNGITSITVDAGSTFNLYDGVGVPISNLTNLSIGNGALAGTVNTILELEAADAGSDTLTTSLASISASTTAGQIIINVRDAGMTPSTSYTLLSAPGGGLLNGGAVNYFALGALGGYAGSSITQTDTSVILNVGTAVLGDMFFTGLDPTNPTKWNIVDGSFNGVNWSSTKDGLTQSTTVPGAGTSVVFQADNATGGAVSTTLEQSFRINNLVVETSTTSATSVAIGPGAIATNRLTIAPSTSTDGILLKTGAATSLAISAPVTATGPQTWTTTDAGQSITLTGALAGSGNITKAGLGKLTISGAGGTYSGTMSANAGAVELTNVQGLGGTTVAGVGGPVSIGSGGAFYYNNATAGIVTNNLTLAGGTLSAASNSQTYSGSINASADSTINMRDSNNAVTSTTQRSITLSGAISGAGKITLDSIDTLTTANPITGTLTLSGNNSSWSGGLAITRGTVTASNVNSLGTGPITVSGGKIAFTALGGSTYNLGQTLAVDGPSSYLELNADAGGTPISDMTVNFNGAVTLGSVSNAAALRIIEATDNFSVINFKGGIVLGNNASISVGTGSTTRNVTIDTIGISETLVGSILTINDDQGVWNQTNQRLAINVASSYTGGTKIESGTLILGHKDAIGTGSLTTQTGASTLQAGVDLSATGSGPLPNAVILNAALTVSGTNNLTLGGTLTGTGLDTDRTLTSSITTPAKLELGAVNIGAAANTLAKTLTIAGTGNTNLAGVVADGNAFANNLTITNTGITTISNVNTFSGTTTMNAATGTLLLQGSNSSAGGTTLTTGKIQFDSSFNGGLASGTVALNGGTIEALNVGRSLANAVNIGAAVTVAGAKDITFTGTTTTTATNANSSITNSLTAGTFMINGPLALAPVANNAARTLTVTGTGNTTVAGDITNGSSFANVIVKSGTGVLTFSSGLGNAAGTTGNTYTGGTTVNLGTLRSGASHVLPNTGTLTVNATSAGTALVDLANFDDTISALTFGSSTTSLAGSVNQVTTGTGTLTLGGTVTTAATAATPWTTAPSISGKVDLGSATRTFTIGDSTASVIDFNVDAVVSSAAGTFGITKNGLGLMQLNAANSYTGATTVNNGTLRYGISAAIPITSGVNVNGNATGLIATLDLNNLNGTIASLSFGGTGQTATSAAIVQTGTGTLTLGGNVSTSATGNPTTAPIITGKLDLGTATRTFTVADSTGSAVDLDVQAVISGGTNVGITKAGAGVLKLSTANSYSGTTTINPATSTAGGVILASATGALGTGPVTVVMGTGALSAQLQLTGGITLTNNFTTSGAGLDAPAGTNGLIRSVSGSNTISGNLNLTGGGGSTTLRADSGAALTLSGGNIGSTANLARDLTLTGGGNFVINSVIRNSNQANVADSVNLVINNTGTTTLNGTNTYTGPTSVAAGSTAIAGNTQAFGVGSNTTVDGTLRLAGFSTSLGSLTGASTGIVENANATAATLTVGNATNPAAFAGVIQDGTGGGALSLTKVGAGGLTLTGTNTYTGKTVVQNGGIFFSTGDAVATNAQGLGKHTDVDLGVAATSSGALIYTGAAGTLAKNINALGNGSDTVANTGSGLLTLSGTLTKNGTTLTLNGGANGIDVTGTITGAAASSDLIIDAGITTLSNANTYNGPTFIRNGGTLNANVANALPTSPGRTSVTFDGTGTSTLALGANQFVSALTAAGAASVNLNANDLTVGTSSGTSTFAGVITGSGNLIKDGASTLALTGLNTYTGTTTVTGGTLSIGNVAAIATDDQALGKNAAVNLGVASTSSGILSYTGAAATLGKDINILGNGSDTIQNNGTGLLTLAGTLTKNGTTLTLSGGANGIAVTGMIVGASTASDLIVSGGFTTLSAANTYNGPTTVTNNGTLTVTHNSGLGTDTFGTTVDSGSSLILSGVNVGNELITISGSGVGGLGALQSVGSSTLGAALTLAADSVIGVAGSGDTLYLSGNLSGSFGYTKVGAGTIVVSGSGSSYSGTTTVSEGTMTITDPSALGTGAGGTVVSPGATLALGGVTIGNEPLTLNSTGAGSQGTLASTSGTNAFGGDISFTGGYATFRADSGTVLNLTGANIFKANTVLTLNGPGTINISNVIGGDGIGYNDDLVVNGATVQLNAQNTYTGPTYVRNGGTLKNGINDALPNSSTVGGAGSTDLTIGHSGDGAVTNTYDLNGYNQSIASLHNVSAGGNTNIITNGGATDSTLSVSAGIYSGLLQDGGTNKLALVKQGAGGDILTLSGANTHSGGTTVNSGTLNITNTTGSATGSGNLTVAVGATLAGTGKVVATGSSVVTINGALVIGDATAGSPTASVMDITTASGAGSTIFGASSFLMLDLFTAGTGDESGNAAAADMLRLFGDVNITSGATLVLGNPGSLTAWADGDKFKIIDWSGMTSRSGTFSLDISSLGLTGPLYVDTSSLYTDGTILITIAAIPEPGRASLLVVGFAGLMFRRRRKTSEV